MKAKEKIRLAIPLALFFCLFTLEAVGAKEKVFPEKPIQFLVGFVPGSVTDLSARALSKVATEYIEKPLVVVNMPGDQRQKVISHEGSPYWEELGKKGLSKYLGVDMSPWIKRKAF